MPKPSLFDRLFHSKKPLAIQAPAARSAKVAESKELLPCQQVDVAILRVMADPNHTIEQYTDAVFKLGIPLSGGAIKILKACVEGNANQNPQIFIDAFERHILSRLPSRPPAVAEEEKNDALINDIDRPKRIIREVMQQALAESQGGTSNFFQILMNQVATLSLSGCDLHCRESLSLEPINEPVNWSGYRYTYNKNMNGQDTLQYRATPQSPVELVTLTEPLEFRRAVVSKNTELKRRLSSDQVEKLITLNGSHIPSGYQVASLAYQILTIISCYGHKHAVTTLLDAIKGARQRVNAPREESSSAVSLPADQKNDQWQDLSDSRDMFRLALMGCFSYTRAEIDLVNFMRAVESFFESYKLTNQEVRSASFYEMLNTIAAVLYQVMNGTPSSYQESASIYMSFYYLECLRIEVDKGPEANQAIIDTCIREALVAHRKSRDYDQYTPVEVKEQFFGSEAGIQQFISYFNNGYGGGYISMPKSPALERELLEYGLKNRLLTEERLHSGRACGLDYVIADRLRELPERPKADLGVSADLSAVVPST